jgi:hypothetical protein
MICRRGQFLHLTAGAAALSALVRIASSSALRGWMATPRRLGKKTQGKQRLKIRMVAAAEVAPPNKFKGLPVKICLAAALMRKGFLAHCQTAG